MKPFKVLLCLLLLTPSLALAGRLVWLENPAPIAVPAGMTPAQVEQVIRASAVPLTWGEFASGGPGVIEMTQRRISSRATFSATVFVGLEADKVTITYKTSDGLNFTELPDGRRKIHGTYQRWVGNLAEAIRNNLAPDAAAAAVPAP